ncbi:hypothetical protein Rcae01_01160 [Novipirellula caenicola]|uniref:Uncharacterized protein n=1 Tax=Novipirellula caenicola TaxID=1536901 RepID=A0ABP9VKJ8_9BACT
MKMKIGWTGGKQTVDANAGSGSHHASPCGARTECTAFEGQSCHLRLSTGKVFGMNVGNLKRKSCSFRWLPFRSIFSGDGVQLEPS